jgi:hypothetical protein
MRIEIRLTRSGMLLHQCRECAFPPDLPPKKVAIAKETNPVKLTEGRSRHEAQALHRRADHCDPEGA